MAIENAAIFGNTSRQSSGHVFCDFPIEMDRLDCNWDFYQDPKGKWWWKCENPSKDPSLIAACERGFDTLEECTEDAIRHGFHEHL